MSYQDPISVARTAIELCDGEGQPPNATYAEKIALAQAYATLAVAEETSRLADNLSDVEQRIERAADTVAKVGFAR